MNDEQVIRAARDELNDAVADRNTAVFSRYWLDDVQITAGSGEALGNSRARHVKRFVATFADPSFDGGIRRTTRVEVSADNSLAAEHGEWEWRYRIPATPGTTALQTSHGIYLVMWRKKSGAWRIQSETYVMMRVETESVSPT